MAFARRGLYPSNVAGNLPEDYRERFFERADPGLRIKKASRHEHTWFVSLANEWIGYVPTAQAFVGGGYEPRTARSSKLAADAGQKLVEGAAKALGRVLPAKGGKK